MNIGGVPAIINLLETISKATVEEIIVVTGHNSELLIDEIDKFKAQRPDSSRIKTVYNENYNEGMFTSIQCGLKEALSSTGTDSSPGAVLLFPVDSPLISFDSIQTIIDAWTSIPDRLYVPCYRGKKGHPLLIPSIYYDEILRHDGSGGLKAITQKYSEKMTLIDTKDESVVIDMDTLDDYHYTIKHRENTRQESVKSITEKRNAKIILVRHGSTEQQKDKIFLGQSDVPLSEIGKEDALKAAIKLSKMQLESPRIWSSTLSRASETATIIADNISFCKAVGTDDKIICNYLESLKEINLGSWDGKQISEIKRRFPEEYKKRGEDILRYKQGNDFENFYDLRYRVIRAFLEILDETPNNQAIIIVSHAGPIRMIIAEHNEISLEEALKMPIPKATPLQIDGQLW